MRTIIILALMVTLMAVVGLALAGPGPNSPWQPTGKTCSHPSDPDNLLSGLEYYNTNSGKPHCFKAD